MRAYHDEIVDNVVAYIAQRYYDETQKYIPQMILYKVLAFFDFACLKKYGRPCTELVYNALEMGPVPYELYNDVRKGVNYKTECSYDDEHILRTFIATSTPNMDYISVNEKKILDNIIDFVLKNKVYSKKISRLSHNLPAWKKAIQRGVNSTMDYGDAFDNLLGKSDDEKSLTEERYEFYKEMQELQDRLCVQNSRTI